MLSKSDYLVLKVLAEILVVTTWTKQLFGPKPRGGEIEGVPTYSGISLR